MSGLNRSPEQQTRPSYTVFGEKLYALSPRLFTLVRFIRRLLLALWRRRIWVVPLCLILAGLLASSIIVPDYRFALLTAFSVISVFGSIAYLALHIHALRERLAHEALVVRDERNRLIQQNSEQAITTIDELGDSIRSELSSLAQSNHSANDVSRKLIADTREKIGDLISWQRSCDTALEKMQNSLAQTENSFAQTKADLARNLITMRKNTVRLSLTRIAQLEAATADLNTEVELVRSETAEQTEAAQQQLMSEIESLREHSGQQFLKVQEGLNTEVELVRSETTEQTEAAQQQLMSEIESLREHSGQQFLKVQGDLTGVLDDIRTKFGAETEKLQASLLAENKLNQQSSEALREEIETARQNTEKAMNMAMLEQISALNSVTQHALNEFDKKLKDLSGGAEKTEPAKVVTPKKKTKNSGPVLDQIRQRHHLLNQKSNFAYCYLAKNMCSTLKYHFMARAHADDQLEMDTQRVQKDLHDLVQDFEMKEGDLDKLKSDMYVFAVLRDPKERMVSAYLSKFVRPVIIPGFARKVINAISDKDVDSFTFSDFVKYACETDPLSLDEHWAPQSQFLFEDIEYDLIPLEDVRHHQRLKSIFGDDFADLRLNALSLTRTHEAAADMSLADLRSNLKEFGILPSEAAMLNRNLTSMIDRVFADDLALLESARKKTPAS